MSDRDRVQRSPAPDVAFGNEELSVQRRVEHSQIRTLVGIKQTHGACISQGGKFKRHEARLSRVA